MYSNEQPTVAFINERFSGDVTVTVGNTTVVVPASEFVLTESDRRYIGDGEYRREELWTAPAPIDDETDEPMAAFEEVFVNVVRHEGSHYEFVGLAQVQGAPLHQHIQVEDNLVINDTELDFDDEED